jgi:hypothetical protein
MLKQRNHKEMIMQTRHTSSSSLAETNSPADEIRETSELTISTDDNFVPIRYELTRHQAFLRDLFRWSFIIAPPAIATSFVFANTLPPTYYGLMNGFTTSSFATIAAFSSAFGRFTHPGDFYRDHAYGSRCNPDHHLGKGFGLTMLKNLVTICTTSAAGLGVGLALDIYQQDLLLGSISRSLLLKSIFTILAATSALAIVKYALQCCISEETMVEENPRLHWVQKGWRSYIARPASTIFFMLMLNAFIAIAGRSELTENPHMQLLALPVDQLINWLDNHTLAVGLIAPEQPDLSTQAKAKKFGIEFGKMLLAIAIGVAVIEAFAKGESLSLQLCVIAWGLGVISSTIARACIDHAPQIRERVSQCTSSLFARCKTQQDSEQTLAADFALSPV